jgi:CO/xanthine dehydrogenase Mo-binding subunit
MWDPYECVAHPTPAQTNNPLGLFATIASWDGDLLTVHDSTQGLAFVRTALAVALGLPETAVRVLAPFVGGAFGAGLRTWPHVVLAALTARMAGRPVKLVLSRAQMFTSVGYRPPTVQHLTLGAGRTGELVAINHQGIEPTALGDDYAESLTRATAVLYDCPNLSGRTRQVRLNVACPTWMRGPGELPGCSRWNARWTSWPASWAPTRSSCGCATTPRFTRRPAGRGRARRCAPATSRARNDSAGRAALPRRAR